MKIKGNHQNGKNIKPSIENLINSKNGEKKIFYNKINKSNRIKMNKSKKGKFKNIIVIIDIMEILIIIQIKEIIRNQIVILH